ncbi:zinc metalloproteinase nas-14-like [Paramacrobiotus metropolitanus]|uniref:zinc metalloproteinase nas-14-like n=1 Tax=Paramacrobiotus metropolitanus TaxID=2943436 RepID=UPI0024457EC3|nr:zinc metalloproteinase nas-14-like [Paramacrobiotus metropolitanus]
MTRISLFLSAFFLLALVTIGQAPASRSVSKVDGLRSKAASTPAGKAPIPAANRKPADKEVHKPLPSVNGLKRVQATPPNRHRLSPPERMVNKNLKLEKDASVLEGVKIPLFEGDIAGIRQPSETRTALQSRLKSAILDGSNQWVGACVYYIIDPTFTEDERQVIYDGMNEFYYKVEAVQFLERMDEPDYIYIYRGNVGSGCWSYVGRQGGMQYVNLEPDCVYFNTVVHELNHAIGFWHEQSRSDRDNYVDINWDNIPEENQHNFLSYDTSEITHYNHPYDFGSIMHYTWNSFGIDPNIWTVWAKYPMAEQHSITQSYGLSAMDAQDLNRMYRVCGTVYTDNPYGEDGSYSTWFMNGEVSSLHAEWYDVISYVILNHGCYIGMYRFGDHTGYLGELHALAATSLDSNGETVVYGEFDLAGTSWDNDVRSVYCFCN